MYTSITTYNVITAQIIWYVLSLVKLIRQIYQLSVNELYRKLLLTIDELAIVSILNILIIQ